MIRGFVPTDFDPPITFVAENFRLEPLGPQHNDRDHAAWMSSIDHIQATPGFEAADWPAPMTLEANRADLEGHARDFANREGFTYSILDGDDVIGCVYIYPDPGGEHDALVTSWVCENRSEMDVIVWSRLSAWLAAKWPFVDPRYAARK